MRFSSRFSLRKTLTIFNFHRRTKSDTAVILNSPVASNTDPLHESYSLPVLDIRANAYDHEAPSTPDPPDSPKVSPTPINAPRTIPTPCCSTRVKPTVSSSTLEHTIIRQRLAQLEADNTTLCEQISSLLFEASIREEELMKMRGDLLNEKLHNYTQKRATKEEAAKYEAQEKRIAQLEKFISAMIDIGLHIPVLNKAKKAVMAGELADDVLVDAIKEAAAKPGTTWARIMPAIIGPRTDDNYVSAINLTIRTRQELKSVQKIAKFWKKTALLDVAHAGTVTPSPSQLSDIVIPLPERRQCAVDDLLRKMRNGETPIGRILPIERNYNCFSLPVSPSIESGVDAVHSSSTSTERPTLICDPIPMKTSSAEPLPPQQTTTPEQATLVAVDPEMKVKADTSSTHVPLDSQGLCTNQPMKGPPSTSTLKPRAVLGSIDMNISSHTSISSSSSRASKRQGVIFNSSKTTTSNSQTTFESLRFELPRGEDPLKGDFFDNSIDPPKMEVHPLSAQPSNQMRDLTLNIILPPLDESKLAAERALVSLERICAAFSSGSLGSLETVGEESLTGCVAQIRSVSSGPHTVSTDTNDSGTLLSSEPSQAADIIHSSLVIETAILMKKRTSPIKRSMLPVLKGLRRLSVSFSPPRRSVSIPTATGFAASSGQKANKSSVSSTKSSSPASTSTSSTPLKAVKRAGVTSISLSPTRSFSPSTLSKIPALVRKGTPNKRIVDRGKRAVKSLSRILS